MRFENTLRVTPKLAARAEGIPYQVLVDEIVNLALVRYGISTPVLARKPVFAF